MVWWMIASQTKWTETANCWWINLSCLRSPVSGTQEFCNKTIKMTSSKRTEPVSLFQPKKNTYMDPGWGVSISGIPGLVYYQTTHDVMALQPAEKELQEGRPLQELPSWLLPRLVSTGVFSTDEINQVFCPTRGWGKEENSPQSWKNGSCNISNSANGLYLGAFMSFFLLVFLESFKQVWIASTKKKPFSLPLTACGWRWRPIAIGVRRASLRTWKIPSPLVPLAMDLGESLIISTNLTVKRWRCFNSISR